MAAADPLGHARRWVWLCLAAVAIAVTTLTLTLSKSRGDSTPTVSERPAPAHGADCPRAKRVPGRSHSALIVGMNSVWSRRCDEATLAAAGVNWSRLELTWARIERRRGQWNWRDYDHQFATAARAGMTVLPLLHASPSWAAPNENVIPQDPSGFAGFTAQVVARYGPGGAFWRAHPKLPYRPARWFELWNEPYLSNFSSDGIHPDRYARLVQAATTAGRQANGQARFLIEADTTGISSGGSSTPWVDGMYKAVPQLTNFFDAVAVHPYSAPHSPDVYAPGHSRWQFRRIGQIQASFRQHGAGNKPFWITEVGWATCPDQGAGCVSEGDQARYLARVFQLARSDFPFVRALFLYNYRDSATDPSNPEDWFGAFRGDGRAKPAWNVIARFARGV